MTQCAHWTTYVSLRRKWSNMRCDYITPGSIMRQRGSAEAERRHRTAVKEAKVPGNLRCLKFGVKMFRDYVPEW